MSLTITITEDVQEVRPRRERKVRWTADTIDNEHMNRKKSKLCCIFNSKCKTGCSSKNKYERM